MVTLNPLSSRIHAVIKPLTPPPMTTICFDELLGFIRGWLAAESAISGIEVILPGKMIVVSEILASFGERNKKIFELGDKPEEFEVDGMDGGCFPSIFAVS